MLYRLLAENRGLHKDDVSAFVRDYLSIKQQMTPNVNTVYHAFKRYAEEAQLPIATLLGRPSEICKAL